MAINISVQTVERRASPRHNTVDPILQPSGNPFKFHEEVLYLQPLIPPKRFDISPPDWGMLRRSKVDTFRFFFKNTSKSFCFCRGLSNS